MRALIGVVSLSLLVASTARTQCSPATQALITERRFEEARAEPRAALGRNSTDDAALHCMGQIEIEAGNVGEAVGWFEKAVKANDRSSAHHVWLGNSLGEQAAHTNKLKLPFLARRIKGEFDLAVALDPSSIDARHGLIQFYSHAPSVMGGSAEKAREQAREIQKLNPLRGHIEMGALLERDNDAGGAEREYQAAIAAAPDSVAGLTAIGNFYRRQKRYADATSAYEQILKIKPDAVNAHLNIGSIAVASGQGLDRGERELAKWFAAPPKNVSPQTVSLAHYLLGSIYERQAKRDAARSEYQKAVTLNPKNEDAKKALANLK